MKIVINGNFGGFSLSHEAMMLYAKLKGITLLTKVSEYDFNNYYLNSIDNDNFFWDRDIERNDPYLVQVVETLGSQAAGDYADLQIVDVPDDVQWVLVEYDGYEHIAEKHRTWS
jgi:hypothetical protein